MLALCAVCLFAACNKEKEVSVNVSINATSPSFVDGKVDLIVSLSGKSASAVSATIAVSGNIPETALTLDKKVNIAAGGTTATIPVTVNADALEAGDYEAVFSIASVTGGEVNSSKSSCKVSLKVEAVVIIPDVFIQSNSESFTDGKATMKLALSQAAAEDIAVTFSFVSEYEGYSVIGSDALTFDNPVTIPAGSVTKDVEITLDESKLEVGDNVAGIVIDKIEGPGKKASTKQTAWIFAVGALKAEEVTTWKLSYAGRDKATNGKVYDWILVEGWTGDYYDVSVFEEGTLASVNGDVTVVMQYMYDNYVGKYLGQYTIDQLLRSQATYCNFSILDPGNYEVYLVDYTKAGAMTGKYAMATITVEEEEATDEFNAILGVYNLTSSGYHAEYNNGWTYPNSDVNMENVYIYPNVNNLSYVVYFPEWSASSQKYFYYPAVFDWDSETGALSAVPQKLDEWTDSDYGQVDDWQYGYVLDEGKTWSVTGSYTIMQSEGLKDGVIVCNAGPAIELQGGGTYDILGLHLGGNLVEYDQGQYSYTYMQIPFPATFTRVSDLPADEEEETASVLSVRKVTRRPAMKTPVQGKACRLAAPVKAVKK